MGKTLGTNARLAKALDEVFNMVIMEEWAGSKSSSTPFSLKIWVCMYFLPTKNIADSAVGACQGVVSLVAELSHVFQASSRVHPAFSSFSSFALGYHHEKIKDDADGERTKQYILTYSNFTVYNKFSSNELQSSRA